MKLYVKILIIIKWKFQKNFGITSEQRENIFVDILKKFWIFVRSFKLT